MHILFLKYVILIDFNTLYHIWYSVKILQRWAKLFNINRWSGNNADKYLWRLHRSEKQNGIVDKKYSTNGKYRTRTFKTQNPVPSWLVPDQNQRTLGLKKSFRTSMQPDRAFFQILKSPSWFQDWNYHMPNSIKTKKQIKCSKYKKGVIEENI